MLIPPHLTLSAEDIRHLRHSQLAQLTGIDASSFSAWSHYRCLSERTLNYIAGCLGLSKADVLRGFDLRRQDVVMARLAQDKADQLIRFINRHSQQGSA